MTVLVVFAQVVSLVVGIDVLLVGLRVAIVGAIVDERAVQSQRLFYKLCRAR